MHGSRHVSVMPTAIWCSVSTIRPSCRSCRTRPAKRRGARYGWRRTARVANKISLLLDRTLKLRYELAQLHGMPDYATYAIKRRMAQTPAAVNEFLAKVQAAVDEVEARELAELRADKAKFTGTDPAVPMFYRWDVAFHQERVRRARFKIDQEALRAYFPTDKSIQYTIKLAERLYGISVRRAQGARVARRRAVTSTFSKRKVRGKIRRAKPVHSSAAFISTCIHARASTTTRRRLPCARARRLAKRTPISVLVTNFDRKGLNHDELETLLHEFGHVLHGVLSKTRYADQSGTSVKRDFVEAPSQMFEEWARREEALKLLAEVCPDCPRLTSAQIEQLDSARKYGQGIRVCSGSASTRHTT